MNLYEELKEYVKNNFPLFDYTYQLLQIPEHLNISNTNNEFKKNIRNDIKELRILNFLDVPGIDLLPMVNYTYNNELENINKKVHNAIVTASSESLDAIDPKYFFVDMIQRYKQ